MASEALYTLPSSRMSKSCSEVVIISADAPLRYSERDCRILRRGSSAAMSSTVESS